MDQPTKLQYPVALAGDLSTERWPEHLKFNERIGIIKVLAMRRQFLDVLPLFNEKAPEGMTQFLIGNWYWSRKLMINARDPMGIIYLITDDGTRAMDLSPEVDRAVTLTALLENVDLLEPKSFENERLRSLSSVHLAPVY